MKFGKLFTKLITNYPQFATLSNNYFSKLQHKELISIAKQLKVDNHLFGNYTHDTTEQLAQRVYAAVVSM